MKTLLKHITPIILSFALGALVFHSKPTPRQGCIQQVPAKAINYITNNTVPVIVKEVRYKSIRDTIHDTIKIPVDSAKLAQDWLTKRYYNPVILDDSNGVITAKLMVTKNRLASWQVHKKLFVHSYKVYPPPVRKLFLGGGVIAYPDKVSMLAGGIYMDKHERAFGFMVDPVHNGIYLSAYWKLSFKKK